jgi:hypothetical protein
VALISGKEGKDKRRSEARETPRSEGSFGWLSVDDCIAVATNDGVYNLDGTIFRIFSLLMNGRTEDGIGASSVKISSIKMSKCKTQDTRSSHLSGSGWYSAEKLETIADGEVKIKVKGEDTRLTSTHTDTRRYLPIFIGRSMLIAVQLQKAIAAEFRPCSVRRRM